VEELWRFALESMPNELQNPPEDEECRGEIPQAVKEESSDENNYRDQNGWNSIGMAKAIHRMLMAARVPGNPLFAGASA